MTALPIMALSAAGALLAVVDPSQAVETGGMAAITLAMVGLVSKMVLDNTKATRQQVKAINEQAIAATKVAEVLRSIPTKADLAEVQANRTKEHSGLKESMMKGHNTIEKKLDSLLGGVS